MSKDQEMIIFYDDNDEEIQLEVLEQTTIAGKNYLLVLDEDEDTVLLLREIPEEGDYVSYEVVEDDTETEAILKVFKELLEDVDIEF